MNGKMPVWEDSYTVIAMDADVTSAIKLSRLTGYMQETAWHHAINLGYGTDFLKKNRLVWVLVALELKITAYPQWMEAFRIKTMPVGMDRLYYLRDFILYDASGKQLGIATSRWLLIDKESKRPKKVITKYLEELFSQAKPVYPKAFEDFSLPVQFTETTVPVEFSDLDFNHHVNSNRYIDWLINTFSSEYLKQYCISQVSIQFFKEIQPGSSVKLRKYNNSGNTYVFEGYTSTHQKPHFLGKMLFLSK